MSGPKMSVPLRVIKKALADENVMGFDGLQAFEHIQKNLVRRKAIPKGDYPVQVLRTKLGKKHYAAAVFGDTPDDVWGVVELKPHKDAYIGDTFKLRWVGHEVSPPKELISE